jgi:molybdenum cofactor cytidylyltransferase
LDALEAIVLAGGAGSRFGGAKLIAPWRGGALIDGALRAAFAAPVRTVTVVTGANDRVADIASAFAERAGERSRLNLVHCPDYAEGMSRTLRAGIAALPSDASGAFVFLGDMPLIPTAILPALAAKLEGGALAAAPFYKGQRGHPVLFSRDAFPALLALNGDQGAREVLQSLGAKLGLVATLEEGVVVDIDSVDDLEQLEGRQTDRPTPAGFHVVTAIVGLLELFGMVKPDVGRIRRR